MITVKECMMMVARREAIASSTSQHNDTSTYKQTTAYLRTLLEEQLRQSMAQIQKERRRWRARHHIGWHLKGVHVWKVMQHMSEWRAQVELRERDTPAARMKGLLANKANQRGKHKHTGYESNTRSHRWCYSFRFR